MTDWQGVFPAITTQFKSDQTLDPAATAALIERLVKAGCHGIIVNGTLGEGSALEADEKRAVLKLAIETVRGRVPVLTGVAEYTTKLACRLAADAEKLGAAGLMVLPAMVYKSDSRETLQHYRTIARASGLPIMVYNNPIAYKVDVTPAMFADLASERTIVAIKESSDDVRRISDIFNECGDRYTLFCGVDDLALEALMLGCKGWVAGLVNAFPEETMAIHDLARAGRYTDALQLYRWFMPLLHLDVSTKLVQYIKLAQAETGTGTETVRAPRLVLEGQEREHVLTVIRQALQRRPKLAA